MTVHSTMEKKLISLTSLSRKLDKAAHTIKARVKDGRIVPAAFGERGQPLFDLDLIESYKGFFKYD